MISTLKAGETFKKTQYEKLGGEQGVRQLAALFYQEMDSDSEVKELREMHGPDLNSSEEKLFLFLSGWLGGPSLYIEKHGHPRLRARHLPFKIGIEERDQWMRCINAALTKMNLEQTLYDELMQAFFNTADFMRNQ